MARRWCVNFEVEPVLQNGLGDGMWLMQYQYFHTVFTVPVSLHRFFRRVPAVALDLLFDATSETLLALPRAYARGRTSSCSADVAGVGGAGRRADRPQQR